MILRPLRTPAIVAAFILLASPSRAQERGVTFDPPATSQGDPTYADDLIARAHAAHLEDDVQWLRLGHWYRGASGDMRAEPDGPAFWLAEDGKTNPSAELDATIRGIWAPEMGDARQPGMPERVQHPFCRFPARMMFFDARLHLDAARLPKRECLRWREWHDKLQPDTISLVFSSYYLNNPASAFGHTFLRIHKRGNKRGSELLDTGIDYSATVDTGNALVYAFKGMVGLFAGTFHSVPFFLKVREYNDYESRDLWEYELNLTRWQIEFVVAHLWEEGSTYFDYYYLSENCSYHILRTIEACDPRLDLVSRIRYPVAPADTVRVVYETPGLVRSVKFRPSLRTKFTHETATMTSDELSALDALMDDPDAPMPASLTRESRARVLDAAGDWVDIRFRERLVDEKNPAAARLKLRLLERRAEIAVASDESPVPAPMDKLPHIGHQISRVGLGTGWSPEVGGFWEGSYRMALHDLVDATDGYPESAHIEFAPTKLRFYPKDRSLELEDASIVRVMSLSPRARAARGLSWTIRAGGTRLRDDGCNDCFVGLGQIAGGPAFGIANSRVILFAMADLEAQYAPRLHGILDGPARVGVGPLGGVRVKFDSRFLWLTTGSWSYLPFATATQQSYAIESQLRWEFAKDAAVGVDVRKQPLMLDGVLAAYLYY